MNKTVNKTGDGSMSYASCQKMTLNNRSLSLEKHGKPRKIGSAVFFVDLFSLKIYNYKEVRGLLKGLDIRHRTVPCPMSIYICLYIYI